MKKESEFILWFSDINMESLPQVGGKAASLGEMFNMKLPIPNGFCITAEGYQYFLDETNIKNKIAKLLENLDVENTDVLEETAKKIQELIVKQEIPIRIKNSILESYELMNVSPDLLDTNGTALSFIKAGRDLPYVAVRSSATAEDLPQASFAGQQETFLNVKGNKNLLESIKKCWASLFTARAIYYRTKNNFDHIKVYWIMTGVRIAQVALSFGADDIDGTVTEERIVHMAGAKTPELLSVNTIQKLILETGREPIERDSVYNVVSRNDARFGNHDAGLTR